jgi:hypothetical protein
MTAENPDTQRQPPPSSLVRCLRIAAAAAVLLALSESLWLWQTWPVRELLQHPTPALPVASQR